MLEIALIPDVLGRMVDPGFGILSIMLAELIFIPLMLYLV